MRWRFCFLLLFLSASVYSETQDKVFEEAYDKIQRESAYKDLNASLVEADSLLRSSSLPVNQMRCLMLIARLYQQKEELDKSIEYALKIDRLAIEARNYTWQTRANGYLAGLYRISELYGKARGYSQKALEILPKINDPEEASSTRAFMFQELAFASNCQGDYEQAVRYLQEAGESILKVQHKREFLLMNNQRLLGDNYRLMSRYDSALVHYDMALDLSANQPVHYVIGMVYKGMAETFLKKGDLNPAKKYLDEAERFADQTGYLQIKKAIYALSKEYYAHVNDKEKLAVVSEKSSIVKDTLLDKRALVLDKMYGRLEQSESQNRVIDDRKDVVIVVAAALLVSGVVFFAWYKRCRRRELEQVKAVLERLSRSEIIPGPDIPFEAVTDFGEVPDQEEKEPERSQATAEKRIMSPETERILLARFAEFEKSGLFLENGFSLSSLATHLDTNTKYISYLIRKYKESDYNGYVNELRINFAIKMLKENPQWRQYKISALASESGFSSHSQFAAVFKQQTGLPPSAFIKHLTEELG